MKINKGVLYAIYNNEGALVACIEAKNRSELAFLISQYEKKAKVKITGADTMPAFDLITRG